MLCQSYKRCPSYYQKYANAAGCPFIEVATHRRGTVTEVDRHSFYTHHIDRPTAFTLTSIYPLDDLPFSFIMRMNVTTVFSPSPNHAFVLLVV